MSTTASKPTQRYRGMAAEDRFAERRDRLIEAGIELFGTRGYADSPVKAICREAGLTERYFYESFRNREDLLIAVFHHLVQESYRYSLKALHDAPEDNYERIAAGLHAYFAWYWEDRRRAQIMLFEVLGVSPAVDEAYRSALATFASVVYERAIDWVGPSIQARGLNARLLSTGLVGTAVQMAMAWAMDDFRTPVDEIVHNTAAIFRAMLDSLTA